MEPPGVGGAEDLRYLGRLQEATAALAGALTVEAAVAAITETGADTLGADWCALVLAHGRLSISVGDLIGKGRGGLIA